jgi:hypothetical protein
MHSNVVRLSKAYSVCQKIALRYVTTILFPYPYRHFVLWKMTTHGNAVQT